MPVTLRGLIYYPDDPHHRVFRTVIPRFDDAELDQYPGDAYGRFMMNGNVPHTWCSFGVDPARPLPVMDKVSCTDTKRRLRGTPSTPADEPVIYWINIAVLVEQLDEAERDRLHKWLEANPHWSNNFVNLGYGSVDILSLQCQSPCWIVIAGKGSPAIGQPVRTIQLRKQTLTLWVA